MKTLNLLLLGGIAALALGILNVPGINITPPSASGTWGMGWTSNPGEATLNYYYNRLGLF